jgi:hypothetical protein
MVGTMVGSIGVCAHRCKRVYIISMSAADDDPMPRVLQRVQAALSTTPRSCPAVERPYDERSLLRKRRPRSSTVHVQPERRNVDVDARAHVDALNAVQARTMNVQRIAPASPRRGDHPDGAASNARGCLASKKIGALFVAEPSLPDGRRGQRRHGCGSITGAAVSVRRELSASGPLFGRSR